MDYTTYLSRFQNAKKISEGMSSDEKYHCIRDNKECLLRIADGSEYEQKKAEYEHLERLSKAGLPVPECIDFSKSDDGAHVFTLLSWIPGEDADQVLPKMNHRDQYELGTQAGDILRRIHETAPAPDLSKNWYDRYFEVIEPRLDAFKQKGIPFEGSETILGFIEDNKHLLKTRPLCHHHGDYHMGNLIVRNGKVWVIDWHTVDFDGVGDPWYEFNRLGIDYPAFATGQIDGYFDNEVPEEFWKLFALYLATSTLTSIVWAKYRAPEALNRVMERNQQVLGMFDQMENPVPLWHREQGKPT